MTRAEDLFKRYNAYRFRTANARKLGAKGWLHSLTTTPARLAKFEAMDQWCTERGIDSAHWLHSLFETRLWRFAPRLEHLISPKHLKKYPHLKPSASYANEQQREVFTHKRATAEVFDANRDLSGPAEARKRRHLAMGTVEQCLREMTTHTMGFHPKSNVCSRCPAARECEAEIQACTPFDIMALRRGQITLQQAQMVASAQGVSRGC